MVTRRHTLQLLATATLAAMQPAWGREASRPMTRILIGWPPGNAHDYVARLIAEKIQEATGQPAIVENKPGANQRLALAELRRAAPDGRVLMVCTSAPFTTFPLVYKDVDYDPDVDFTPIAGATSFDLAFVVAPQLGVSTLPELVEWFKANPREASYGSFGIGGLSHLVGAGFAKEIGLDLTHVPYKGSPAAMGDVSTGRIPLIIAGMGTAMDLVRSDKGRVVAISGAERSSLLPDVPTLKELGYTVSVSTSLGVYGPADMDPALVERLNQIIVSALDDPDTRARIAQQSVTVTPSSSAALKRSLVEERQAIQRLVDAIGYEPQ